MLEDQVINAATARSIQTDVARSHPLSGWAVLRDPPDYAGKVIGRLLTTKGQAPYMLVADSLAELQAQLPAGLERIDRRSCDLPELVEVWLTR